ncbi:MAG: hypothetical protein ABFD64_00040 [Armatimonadota bacterium]
MLSESDKEFIADINHALSTHSNLRQAVNSLGRDYNEVYNRIRKLGYKLATESKLVPIHGEYVAN